MHNQKRIVFATILAMAVVLAGGWYLVEQITALAHTNSGGAIVPTTFTMATTIPGGRTISVPVPTAPHDLLVVVAVEPNPEEPIHDSDHGVGVIFLIRNGSRVSYTALNSAQGAYSGNNLNFAGGSPLVVNPSGTIRLDR